MVKKVLIIGVVLGALLSIALWMNKRQENAEPATDKSGQPSAQVPSPSNKSNLITAELSLMPSIEAIVKNMQLGSRFSNKYRIEILQPLDALVIATPNYLDTPKIEHVDNGTPTKQKSWRDNFFNYTSFEKPTGAYIAELLSPAAFDSHYFCYVKGRTATCLITQKNTKVTPK